MLLQDFVRLCANRFPSDSESHHTETMEPVARANEQPPSPKSTILSTTKTVERRSVELELKQWLRSPVLNNLALHQILRLPPFLLLYSNLSTVTPLTMSMTIGSPYRDTTLLRRLRFARLDQTTAEENTTGEEKDC